MNEASRTCTGAPVDRRGPRNHGGSDDEPSGSSDIALAFEEAQQSGKIAFVTACIFALIMDQTPS